MPLKLKPHLPALLLIPAVLSLFWPTLLKPSLVLFPTFSPFSDVMVIHWPKAHLLAQSWQAGAGLPYWTPSILSGMPLAANQLAMLFYPPAWLFLFLPLEPVFNGLFIFHFLLGGFGIYLLLRERFGVSPAAALLGGLTFALNGKWLAHAAGGHVSMVGAIGWMPWTVLGVLMWLEEQQPFDKLRIRSGGAALRQAQDSGPGSRFGQLLKMWLPGSGWAIIIVVSLAMQVVTHTLPVIYSGYLIIAMVIWQAANQADVSRFAFYVLRFMFHSLMRLLPLLILAGLLGAAQLLPLLELAQFSNRTLSLSEATEFALSPVRLLVGLLLPSAQAGHEYIIYAGLIPLLLAPFGLSHKNRWTWFFGLLFVFAIVFAIGPNNPLYILFYYVMPGFRWVRTPARIFFVGALALAVLTGCGAEHLAQKQWSAAARKGLTRLTVALGPLALLAGLGLAFGLKLGPLVQRSALALAIFIPLGLALILLRAQRLMSASVTMIGLGLLLFLDLAWFDMSMLRFVPLEQALAPGRAAAAYLGQQPGYFRVYSPSYSLPMSTAAAAGLSLTDGVEPVHLAVYDQFMARAGGYNDPGFSVTIPKFGPGPLETSLKEVEPNLKLLGLLNVTYLASAFPMTWPGLSLETQIEGTFIYRNERAMPRAWVAHQAVSAEADWLKQLESLPDVGDVVIIDPTFNVQHSTFNVQRSNAEITHYSADHIEIETEITQPGWLVVSEIWYPGWQATINGAVQPVKKVDGLLRGLYLNQPGAYRISLIYQPDSVVWGNRISGLTLGLLVLASLWLGWDKFNRSMRSER